MYLNPVLRYDGALPEPAASVDPTKTTVLRVAFAAGIVGGLVIYWRKRQKSRLDLGLGTRTSKSW
jgi:hypothetical protein